MFFGKKGLRFITIVALFALALMFLSPISTPAADNRTTPVKTTFNQLISKLRRATLYLSRSVTGKKPVKRLPLVAVRAKQKQNSSPKTAPEPKSAPPMPAEATRIGVSASGPFAAEIEAERHAFTADRKIEVAYAAGFYYLVQDGQPTASSNQPIKFVPTSNDSILNIPEYQDMNWNKTVNLNAWRGNIKIVYSDASKQLWAVNELGLEDYLCGIAEASHDAPEEHLKVMAIVSRSYAVHHLANGGRHPGEPFDLKNSRNGNGDDQVYRGYLSETRQPRIAKAAADTLGTVVTYEGKPVITPYSTQAGGRTLSPKEAGWSVDWPWVKSVPDPDTAGLPRIGHGVGLSGTGSRKRAERGETAAEILGYYFPGTALGQVDTGGQVVRVGLFGKPVK